MSARRMTLTRLLAAVTPGSQPPPWTWNDETRWLWHHQPDQIRRLAADIARNGQQQPVVIGNDGRLWDGHHRVAALLHLGRTYVTVTRWDDLTDDEQADHLIDAISDWEATA